MAEKSDKGAAKAAKPKTEKKADQKAETKTESKAEAKAEAKSEIRPKLKPELDDETRAGLEARRDIKRRTPNFRREEWFRYKKLSRSGWRRPDGITSKMRRGFKYRPTRVSIGFGGPANVRGLHPSGFEEVRVFNVDDLDQIDPKRQAARIGGSVGSKKREAIEKAADKRKIRILNPMHVGGDGQ